MKNKIKVIALNTQYSIIEVEKIDYSKFLSALPFETTLSKHIISNNGWLDLEYWKKYFTYDF